jgi:hypothetical protein
VRYAKRDDAPEVREATEQGAPRRGIARLITNVVPNVGCLPIYSFAKVRQRLDRSPHRSRPQPPPLASCAPAVVEAAAAAGAIQVLCTLCS